MSEAKQEQAVRVLILGEKGVGKSGLMQRLLTNTFVESPIPSLFAQIKFKEKSRTVKGHPVKYSICDAVKLEDFAQQSDNAKGIDVAYLLYDVTNASSLENIKQYHAAAKLLNPNCKFILLGSKVDLWAEKAAVTAERVEQLCHEMSIHWDAGCFSARTGQNVDEVLDLPAQLVMQPVSGSRNDNDSVPPIPNTDPTLQFGENEGQGEQKAEPTPTPRPKKSCANLFWKFMAHPAIAAIGVVVLLAGVAALLAATYGVGGVALAGVLTIGGSSAAGVGGVSTLLSAIGFCKKRCVSKDKGEVPVAPPAPETTPNA